MKYVIKGEPVAWARAGINGKRFYDAQRHIKTAFGITIMSQHGSLPFYEGPIMLDISFVMPIPKRIKDPSSWEGMPMKSKPDLSNLIKLIEDTGSGILYKDDAIIYKIVAKRVYGVVPRTEFTIKEVNDKK